MGKWIWIIIIIAAVFGVLFGISGVSEKPFQLWERATPTPSPTPAPGSKTSPPSSGTATQTQAYSSVVAQYFDRRIQFDENCSATPSSVTYKNGTKIMLDNRSAMPLTVKIGQSTFDFPAYGYKIITLSSSKPPVTLNMNCDGRVNIGQILIQP